MSDTFIKITNRDIYSQIEDFMKVNREEHGKIVRQQIKTNGKIKSHRLAIGILFTLFLTSTGWLVAHLININIQ